MIRLGNSVDDESDVKSCEMAGIDDGQSGAMNLLDTSFASDHSNKEHQVGR